MLVGTLCQRRVDAARPDNCYVNSITCINSGYNRRCFNDGYHIHHHVKPRTHWSELPTEFQENIKNFSPSEPILAAGPKAD